MNKQEIVIWGRELSLDIIYDCYPDEDVLDVQKEALQCILAMPTVIEESRNDVKSYIQKNNADLIGGVIDNIFNYVKLKALFIPRNKEHRIVTILCDYKFDPEHGIAIVFENEKLKSVGIQDIIL